MENVGMGSGLWDGEKSLSSTSTAREDAKRAAAVAELVEKDPRAKSLQGAWETAQRKRLEVLNRVYDSIRKKQETQNRQSFLADLKASFKDIFVDTEGTEGSQLNAELKEAYEKEAGAYWDFMHYFEEHARDSGSDVAKKD